MKKVVAIVAGDPESISSELIAKMWKKKQNFKNINIFIIGSYSLIQKQLSVLNIKTNIKKVLNLDYEDLYKSLFIYDVPLNFKNPFKVNNKSKAKYLIKCFEIAIKLSKLKKINGFINCPINKKDIFKSNHGITEFLAKKSNILGKEAMIIFNKKLSVCPITTHIKIKEVSKNLTKRIIYDKVKTINKFYKDKFGFKPKIGILGLNPHNYELRNNSEEKKIILPAIKKLQKKGIKVKGPLSGDTAFLKSRNFHILVGMYHDQVWSPYKALYNFDAINITAGLPYVRVSPDHGTGKDIIKKNMANPMSLIESIKFFNKFNV